MKLQIWEVSNHSALTFTSFLMNFLVAEEHFKASLVLSSFGKTSSQASGSYDGTRSHVLPHLLLERRVYVQRKRVIMQSEAES